MHCVHYMHAIRNTLPQYMAEFMGSKPFQACIFLPFFLFFFVCLFVFFGFVLFCFVLFFSVLLFFPSFFSAFPCLSTGRGLVPMLSFPKNAGIVKLLMPSETGRRPRSSMLSSAGNA